MRQTIKSIGLTLLAAAAFVSCAHEALPEIETPEEKTIEKPTTHTIRINAGGQDTRTQIVGTSSLWTDGDRLLVFEGHAEEGYWYRDTRISEPGITQDDGKTMDFQVDFDYIDPDWLSESHTDDGKVYMFKYQAIYPAENAGYEEYDGEHFLYVDMPSMQYPTATSFDPKADVLTSRPAFLMEQPDELSLAFKRQTALGQMTLKGLPEGAQVCLVSFLPLKAADDGDGYNTALLREYVIELASGEEGGWYWPNQDGIVMNLSSRTVTAAEGNNPTAVMASFMCNPLGLAAGDMFRVAVVTKETVTNNTTGEQSVQMLVYPKDVVLGENRELVFTAGDITAFSVNLTGIAPSPYPEFELTFDDYTEGKFPHINDDEDPYIEIPYKVGGSGDDGPIKAPRKTSNLDPGDYVWICFDATHPWTVRFSESWLWADETYMDSDGYGEFRICAETNETGASREATMTIASQFYGEVTIRVVQDALVLPTALTISAPETVSLYQVFEVEGGFIPENVTVSRGVEIYVKEDENYDCVEWLSRYGNVYEYKAVLPGTVTFVAEFDYEGVFLTKELEVTIAEPNVVAPTDWYFLVKRDNKPYLIHRYDGSDTAIKLSDFESAQANDLAITADGKVHVVGAYPVAENDNALSPCEWTYEGGDSASRTVYDGLQNRKATNVAVEGNHVYILVSGVDASGSAGSVVLKDGESIWTLTPGTTRYSVTDIAVEGDQFYLCGFSIKPSNPAGNDPYVWKNGELSSLAGRTLPSGVDHPVYNPESVLVQDGKCHVVGSMTYQYGDWRIYGCWLYWQEGEALDYEGPTPLTTSNNGTYYMFHDIDLIDEEVVIVGEQYKKDYDSSISSYVYSQWEPIIYQGSSSNPIYLNYDRSGYCGLNEVHTCNGVAVLRGTVNGTPAFWAAPWKTPVIWNNADDKMIAFAVK